MAIFGVERPGGKPGSPEDRTPEKLVHIATHYKGKDQAYEFIKFCLGQADSANADKITALCPEIGLSEESAQIVIRTIINRENTRAIGEALGINDKLVRPRFQKAVTALYQHALKIAKGEI